MFDRVRVASGHLTSPAGAFLAVIAGVMGVVLGDGLIASGAPVSREARTAVAETRVLQDGSDWLSEAFWERKRQKRMRQREQVGYLPPLSNPFAEGGDAPPSGSRPADRGHYQTVCVRLCDGYYFPISFSTTRERFAADEQVCQSKCSSEARLFYRRSGGTDAEDLKDRDGRAYSELANAFLYRTRYSPSCQCQAAPWSDEARQRHAAYATEDWQKQQVAERAAARKSRQVTVLKGRREERIAIPQDVAREPAAVASVGGETVGDSRSYRSTRMSLGRARAQDAGRRPRAAARRDDRSWRKRVFNNLTD